MTAGLALLLTSSVSNCLLISDVLGVDPIGAVSVETAIGQAARASANGWFHGCNAALKKQKDDYEKAFPTTNFSSVSTDCWDGYNDGAEPFALYGTAGRNAANNMIPIAKEKSHAYYTITSVDECVSASFANAFLMTQIYLGTFVSTSGNLETITADDLALSTLVGVSGTGQACFEKMVGTGRILAVGGANL